MRFYIMNRAGGIGIAILIIVVIIGVAYSMSSSDTSEDNLPTVEEVILDETISVEEEIVSEEVILDETISVEEEIVSEEPEQTGTDHSVELEESLGFKTP